MIFWPLYLMAGVSMVGLVVAHACGTHPKDQR